MYDAYDCPHCGSGSIVYGSDWIIPCEFCEANSLHH